MVLSALLSDKDAFDFVEPPMSRPKIMHAELVAVSAPAYAAVLV
jgi:hypothetical protein